MTTTEPTPTVAEEWTVAPDPVIKALYRLAGSCELTRGLFEAKAYRYPDETHDPIGREAVAAVLRDARALLDTAAPSLPRQGVLDETGDGHGDAAAHQGPA